MNDYKMVKQVIRKQKASTKFLRVIMLVFAVFFILLGIMISQGFMLPGFLLMLLYLVYETISQKEYEYTLEDNILTIDTIYGRKMRRNAHELNMRDMVVLAPSWHDAVGKYKKKTGSEQLPKFDYTSYEDEIPYYTLIIMEGRQKIKVLLDLEDDMLQYLKKKYPQKVYL